MNEFILYRISLVFPKSALLKQLSLWKRQVSSWPRQAFGVQSWLGGQWQGEQMIGENHFFPWLETCLRLTECCPWEEGPPCCRSLNEGVYLLMVGQC